MLMMPAVKEIFADATPGNYWTNRNPQRIRRTGVHWYIPISTPIHSGMSKYSTPASSDSTGTRITIGTSSNTTAPPCGLNVSPKIYDIRQSATPCLRKSNKLDAAIGVKFPNNLVAPPIFTEVLCDKLSNSYSRDLYTRCQMKLAAYPVNILAPQFVYLGLSTIDTLDGGASLWTPATRVGRPTFVIHWSTPDHVFGKTLAVGDAVSAKSD